MFLSHFLKVSDYRGAWVAQSGKLPIPDFGSGHDLRVISSCPALVPHWFRIGSTLGVEAA